MSSIVTYEMGTVDNVGEMTGVQFGLMSADEVRRLSVVEIRESALYTRGAPTPRGPLDHRLGTVDRRLPCGTCRRDLETCPGHWGHIELPLPVMHTVFIEVVRKVLNCVCYSCSRLRLTDSDAACLPPVPPRATSRKQRLSGIYTTCRSRKLCPHCTAPCPIISRTPVGSALAFELVAEWGHLDPATAFGSEEERVALVDRELDPQLVLDILSDMTPEDIVVLGMDPERTHPRDMVLTALLVPPPIIRPSIMVSEGSRARGQDDLTTRLVEITKRCIQLRLAVSLGVAADIREAWSRLGQEVAIYMHNNPRGTRVATQRSGALTKCLLGRLKGKRGRFRSNLMGKRVNFSGRSVISPDPTLDVDEVGIPITMALQLTVQECVTRANRAELTSRVLRGSGHVDGAEVVIATDGTAIQLEFCTQRDMLALSEGWIVERPLQTGDWVLFNRQPSLHRNSLMGHRVRVMPGKTLRCNLAVVGPYNADFDGDEMNVHVPQSPAATAEVRLLMGVPSQIVSPQAGRPVLGIVQDALLGAHLLTLPDVLLQASQFMAISAATKRRGCLDKHLWLPPPAVQRPIQLWTGKQIIDMLLPPVTLEHGDVSELWAAVLDDDDALVTVVAQPLILRNGRLLSGSLSKATLGASASSIGQQVRLTIGDEQAVGFMGDLQRVVNRYLLERGFSVGIGHCVPSRACDLEMSEGIDRVLGRIDTLQSEVPRWSSSAIVRDSGRVGVERMAVESTVHRMVNNVQMATGNLVRREMRPSNGLSAMVTAGSKGNSINICQIMLCVGQNCVNGERIGRDGPDDRTLPCYGHDDHSVDGAGFVANSYLLGLRGGESFMHAKGGREGLVDTAVKTARTGYIQRRLVKGMESHRADHDQSVRDASDNIVELIYGGDGMNPSRMERIRLRGYALGDTELRQCCSLEEFNVLRATRDEVREARLASPASSPSAMDADAWVALPVDPAGIMCRIRHSDRDSAESVTAEKVESDVRQLVTEVDLALPRCATGPLRLTLQYELRAQQAAGLTCTQWSKVVRQVRSSISAGLIEAGEMVGCIAAQSIGEPATQMTLNTFHLAGVAVGGRGQLSGIPRMSELLDATKVIKTAQMHLRLVEPECPGTETRARSLEMCTLSQVVTAYTMERDNGPPVRADDTMLVAVAALCVGLPNVPVLRLQLNRRLLRRRGATPDDVMRAACGPGVHGVASPEGAAEWILRLWPATEMSEHESAALYSRVMRQTVIGGIAEIELCELSALPRAVVDPVTRVLSSCNEAVVMVEGSALAQIMSESWVDWGRSSSNDVMDVYHTLGVEAARSVIFNELRVLVAGDSGKVDDRHIMLVANTMTHYGVVMPMTRHGINRIAETGPLMRCSFEETSEVLTDAGTFAEQDTLRGVSQSIMFGRTPYAGTGCCEVMREPGRTGVPRRPVAPTGDSRSQVGAGRMVRSAFRGNPIPRVLVPSTDPVFIVAAVDDWEPPYVVDDDMWSDPSTAGASCGLHPEPPSPTEVVRDSHRIRRELVDVISHVPFVLPRSPVSKMT